MDNYWISANGGEPTGPYTISQLQSMWKTGAITAAHVFWRDGFEKWKPILEIETLLKYNSENRVKTPEPPPMPNLCVLAKKSDRQLSVYFALALFFGLLGAHNFYAKRTVHGVIQLGIFLIGFWTIIIPMLLLIWVVGEMITVREDGEGFELI